MAGGVCGATWAQSGRQVAIMDARRLPDGHMT
jgi:hypothetical protein